VARTDALPQVHGLLRHGVIHSLDRHPDERTDGGSYRGAGHQHRVRALQLGDATTRRIVTAASCASVMVRLSRVSSSMLNVFVSGSLTRTNDWTTGTGAATVCTGLRVIAISPPDRHPRAATASQMTCPVQSIVTPARESVSLGGSPGS
jgi:hypothetical protein